MAFSPKMRESLYLAARFRRRVLAVAMAVLVAGVAAVMVFGLASAARTLQYTSAEGLGTRR